MCRPVKRTNGQSNICNALEVIDFKVELIGRCTAM